MLSIRDARLCVYMQSAKNSDIRQITKIHLDIIALTDEKFG
jgi:hypothetical protein